MISTVAGNGVSGYGGDGRAASSAQLNTPGGMTVDSAGNLFIADSSNNVIRKVTPPLYWDPQRTDTWDVGGAGVWTTNSSNKYWYNPSLGADVGWSAGSSAIFSGTAATVTVSGTVIPASITFTTDNYLVVNSTSGDSLMLPSGGTSLDVAGELATINCPIGGSGTLTVTGSGKAQLGRTDTYGGTDLEGGTLQLGSGITLGSGSLTLNDGTLDLNGNSITVASLSGNGGTITNGHSASQSVLTVDQNMNSAYYGSIQDGNGTVGLKMAGSGILVDLGDNAYSGGTKITAGLFAIAASSALPDKTTLTVGAGGMFDFDPSLASGGFTPNLTVPSRTQLLPIANGTSESSDPDPTVASIQCAGTSLVDANAVTFLIGFSQPVTGVVPSDFAATGLGGDVTSVSGAGCGYAVTVNGIPACNGEVGLSLVGGGQITSWLGTSLDLVHAIPVDQQYTIDRQLYWDGSNGPTGDAGVWGPGNDDWRVGSPSGPLQGWIDGSDAVFGGTPGTIEVSSPVVASSLTFLTDGYVLQGDTISLASPQATIEVICGSATIGCPLGGETIAKTGNGALRLGNGFGLASETALTVCGGALDLGGATISGLASVTLDGGSIVDGGLQVDDLIQLYSGTMLADLSGTAALEKLGPDTAVLAGNNTYQGGTIAMAGTLIVAQAGSLPSSATGTGTVVVEPILHWSGSGDWTTGQWQLADGAPTPWIDGSSVVLANRSDLNVSGSVNVGTITVAGDATIKGDTLSLSSWGGMITVLSGTATIDAAVAGGNLTETGPGTLILNGTVTCAGVTVAGGTLDPHLPLPAAPVVAGGRVIGPAAVFSINGQSLCDLDPTIFDLVGSLFVDQSIDRSDMIQILESVAVDGALTTDALDVLKTLTMPQNEASLNIPDDVAALANDVVWGNPANAHYQGQPLGNLADQTSDQLRATALDELVSKWFYGSDLPATYTAMGIAYDVIAGPLYGNNADQSLNVPSSADMRTRERWRLLFHLRFGSHRRQFADGYRGHDQS